MQSWTETGGALIVARHDERDARDAAAIVRELDELYDRWAQLLGLSAPREIAVVLHGTQLQLDMAEPLLPLVRRVTAPTTRRLVAGWPASGTVHVLAPRVLRDRAHHRGDEREVLQRAPGALLVQSLVLGAQPRLRASRTLFGARWAWLVWGAGQLASGQLEYAMPLLRKRLAARDQPSFPPSLADAPLLGGTVLDLLVREEGLPAVGKLLREPLPRSPEQALVSAFRGRRFVHTEGTWRGHLSRIAGAAG